MIDLSLLPAPDVLETLEFETLYQQVLEDFRLQMGDQWSALLESDPVVKLLEVAAYHKLLGRARINDAAKASLLAYAKGADLDHRAADYGVQRLVITPADPDAVPPVEAVLEGDSELRYRTRLSLEALSVAGSRGAYEFHGLSASANVASVSVDSPTFKGLSISAALQAQLPAGAIVLVCDYNAGLDKPLPGDVSLAVLPRIDSPVPGNELVGAVEAALSAEDVRPLTDRPRVQLGQPTEFSVVAALELEAGPDPLVVQAQVRAALEGTIAQARQLQGLLPISAIYAALHTAGVRRVRITQPTADVISDKRHYPSCRSITLSTEVVA
ncbi:baseplate J/gp47 family protein [Pseudomonas sp. BIGb0427]|uniref:baseplate assembly protein n=1 Tax=unclassified Pseudomonas TaxID=196821 RepID=UPI00168EC528|nr:MULTISPECIES: baseplate J/gp47 family protein [unclassified Pseudomonas]NLU59128.1 phage tail protein [Pseudomonas sp. BIGb0427]QPG65651.1 baseplate J/gp47 family protein [Pseudomonas sp. BIGb0427]UVM68098.1 baseplate J/gp47 family protein [Pseudomonas sp. B21-009]